MLQISLSVSYIERLFDKNSVLSIREVFEYKIGCNQLVNNICFICLEDDSLNNCWVKPITSVWNEALGWKLYHFYIVIFSELYNFVSQILLLWREVAEDGAGNGFRDFVHVWDNGIFYGVNMNRYTDMGSYSPAFEKNVCNCLICSIIYNLAGLEE